MRTFLPIIVPLVLGFAVALAPTSCADLQGLDGYENVDCVDCMPDGSHAPPPHDEAGTPAPDASLKSAGACPTPCTGTATCCGSTCSELTTDKANCGTCGKTCMPSEACTNGTCQPTLTGDGADGMLAPTTDAMINTVLTGGASGSTGSTQVTVADVTGFSVNDVIMIHQTRGAGAGNYDLSVVDRVDSGAKMLFLRQSLASSYTSMGDNRAQVVRVYRYTDVTIPAGVTLRARAWDGNKGGILALKATGTVTLTGSIDMTGRGFRGYSHADQCAAGTAYRCTAANTANGFAGESSAGPSIGGRNANGTGGGGGEDGQDCASGAGGGYGTQGMDGVNGSGAVCHIGTQLGGAAGLVVGTADLRTSIFLGGAGGEGGSDEDGDYPGPGGNGGGIVWIDAHVMTVTGSVHADGTAGQAGVQITATCGGGGCGMGGGGGGAGGAVRLRVANNATLGASLITAAGAGGGDCSCATSALGGNGGAGRIGVAGTVTGTTSPALDPH